MIDLHMHILPGLDDGAASGEEAAEMAEIAVRSGTDTAAATSHFPPLAGDAGEYLARYKSALRIFREELKRRKIPLRIVSGMELLVDDSLLRYAKEHRLPGINSSDWILVEFYFDVSRRYALESLDTLRKLGYRMILAHPERYDMAGREPEALRSFYERGIILQVNKGSLFREFGSRAFRAADWMLSEGIAGLVASDAHDPVLRNPDMEEARDVLDLYYGRNASAVLMEENPGRIIGDGESRP